MQQSDDYTLGEILYEGSETRVQRAVHQPSGERVVVKLPVSDSPSLRTVGRLLHEHQILTKLAQIPGVTRPWALEQQGGSAALVLQVPSRCSRRGARVSTARWAETRG